MQQSHPIRQVAGKANVGKKAGRRVAMPPENDVQPGKGGGKTPKRMGQKMGKGKLT